ncbi:MAG TPA: hypothetical protein VF801_07000 [Rhodocyclaceae bacterium]
MEQVREAVSKVPEVTLGFWIIKVAATTLGETGGDWVTMSLKLGYLVGTAIFAGIFVALVAGQIKTARFHRFMYWATIVATTTLGTTMADFFDRSLGVGYPGGAAIICALLLASLYVWYRVEGTVAIRSVTTRRAEWFYWGTILFSQTLGTALGDWTAGSDRGGLGLGYEYGATIFGAALLIVAAASLSLRPASDCCRSGRPGGTAPEASRTRVMYARIRSLTSASASGSGAWRASQRTRWKPIGDSTIPEIPPGASAKAAASISG